MCQIEISEEKKEEINKRAKKATKKNKSHTHKYLYP